MHVIQVVEEDVHVPLVAQVPNKVVDAELAQIFPHELLVGELGVLACDFIAWWRKAENAIADAVLAFDLFRTRGALESNDARNEDGALEQYMLVLVQVQDQVCVQVHQTPIVQ